MPDCDGTPMHGRWLHWRPSEVLKIFEGQEAGPCRLCGHRVFLQDGLCYPHYLQLSEEFQTHMKEHAIAWPSKGGASCNR